MRLKNKFTEDEKCHNLMRQLNLLSHSNTHLPLHPNTQQSLCLKQHELRHYKTNNVAVCPAKTQISLGIRLVWSESSLSAWRKLGSLATHWVHSEDSDQTGQMSRLIRVFAGRTLILLVLSSCGSLDLHFYWNPLRWSNHSYCSLFYMKKKNIERSCDHGWRDVGANVNIMI